jgi:hypothetical protein
MRKRLFIYLFILSIILLPTTLLGEQISFLACDSDTYLINKALKSLQLPKGISVKYFSGEDIRKESSARQCQALAGGSVRDFIAASEVVIVDVMIKELTEYLINETDFTRKRSTGWQI